MSYEPTKIEIDGKEFMFHHLSVRVLNGTLIDIASMCGDSIAELVATGVDAAFEDVLSDKKQTPEEQLAANKEKFKKLLEGIQKVGVKNIVRSLFLSLEKDKVDAIIDSLLSGTSLMGVGTVSGNFEKCFDGSLKLLWKVVFKAMKFYYGDFFGVGLEQ